jgi:LCP family protein required for cell wall assembly
MSTPEREPRSRSAFAAAFLSLIFPGLGHAYAGAYARALAFAALPFLTLALAAGVILRSDHSSLLGTLAQPQVLYGLLVVNVIAFIYRVIAAIDAWQVARFLNAADASGGGRLGRARLPLNPLSLAGLLAVVLVMGGAHVAVAHYNLLAIQVVNCVFNGDTTDASCTQADASPTPGNSGGGAQPSSSGDTAAVPSPTEAPPTPIGSDAGATPAPTLPPWNGTDRLNVLLVGTDQRPGENTFNTDTMIVVSVDPKTRQVAMLQLPRDTSNVPVPANAQSVWGSTYKGKINSWFTANRGMTNLWPGSNSTARGFAALKSILGNLYGININYYVMVNFGGFVDAVDTLGGLQVNVQIPVAEDEFPITDQIHTRVYIPAGPQHMDGTSALVFARSRHGSNDFDRGQRQQRVIVSLKDQMNPQAVLANLTGLVGALSKSVRTDVPTSMLPQLLSLAQSVDTKNIRSYVFSPPFYATDMWGPSGGTNSNIVINAARVRNTASHLFTISPSLLAQRDQLTSEGGQIWVVGGSGQQDLTVNNADYLSWYGMNASAPTKKASSTPASTTITVYNGAEAQLQQTIAFLEKLYGVQAQSVTDPTVPADVVVTLGSNARQLVVPALGSMDRLLL